MPTIHEQFGGLNTDLDPLKLRSGTADVALNVTLEGGDLAKRPGFGLWEDSVTGSTNTILNITSARFGDGDVYVVCKVSGGKLYARGAYGTVEAGFSEISGGQSHYPTDPGWFGMRDGFLYYFDRAGGTKWCPDRNSGTAYKAGLPRPSVGPTPAQAAGGEKEGWYHVQFSYRNSRTKAEGVVSSTHTPPIECRIESADTKSGLAISNWSTIQAADSDYEWDEAVFYTTLGDTEKIGKGNEPECFSYRAYRDAVVGIAQGSVGLNKADHVLDRREAFTNAGGEPPGAAIGCFTSTRGIYGTTYAGTAASLSTALAGDDNDLTYTATSPGPWGNSITVAYTAGGTAGSEVVTVSDLAISVSIETGDGASTAAQIST
ncbi:MAG: hypothetical protein ABII82_00330, partial [Verrucomicrobiota bacterium]